MALLGFWRRGGSSGRTRLITGGGKAIVLSDLHGHHGDWEAFLSVSGALARIRDGEDLWLIITGDAPDVARHRSVDPEVPADGDAIILDALIRAHDELGERAERIVYLEGNHDFHLSRLWREVDRWHVFERGKARAPEGQVPVNTPGEIEAYFEHYRGAYGPAIFANNVAPYDMIHRLQPHHVRFLERGPVLAHLLQAGVVVTHAGPARMGGWRAGPLRRAVDACDREWMRTAAPDAYYRSPYHQLLNNRFRNGDYTLDDVARFLGCWDEAGMMITGHTPHPYLVDFDRRAPLEGCAFKDGLGLVGQHQVVLCSSFGAFTPGLKRYLELDLSRRYRTVEDLFEAGCAKAVRPDAPAASPDDVPGLDVALGLAGVDDAGGDDASGDDAAPAEEVSPGE